MAYLGRPGVSPAVAALVATGTIRRVHRILDVGCGSGTDAVTLASWGHGVVGIDPDPAAVRLARAKARRRGLDGRVAFVRLAAEELPGPLRAGSFDVVLHTLVANNLRRRLDAHFAAVAAMLRPDGLLVLHERMAPRSAMEPPGRIRPLRAAARHFALTRSLPTHLAERGGAYATVALWLGRPRVRLSRPR